MRILDFADSFESSSAPSVGQIAASSFQSFASDAAFVANKGDVAANGDAYYNTTTHQVRVFFGGAWADVASAQGAQTLAGDKEFSDDVTIQGNLTVNGTQTTVNSTTLDTADAQITINKGGNQASADLLGGLKVEMSDATDVTVKYDSSLESKWKIGEDGSEIEVVTVAHQQTLTNKKIDCGLATNNRQILVPKETTANLNALTRVEAALYYDQTSKKLKVDDGTTLLDVGSGGGGGGGSLQWIEDIGSPAGGFEYNQQVYFFVQGETQELWASLKVPETYIAGVQILAKIYFFSPSTSGTALLKSDCVLIRPGTDAISTTANVHGSGNIAETIDPPSLKVREVELDLTDSSGEINGVAVSPGDIIKVSIFRDTDTDTADLRFLPFLTEVSFT